MENINLLPEDLEPKKNVLQLSKKLRRISLISFFVFVISSLILFGILTTLKSRLEKSLSNQQKLRSEVIALEQTEQKVYLIKNRLSLINKSLNQASASSGVEILEASYQLSENLANLEKANISKDNMKLIFKLDSSQEIASFLTNLVNSGNFQNIKMESLTYTPENRYEINLSFKD